MDFLNVRTSAGEFGVVGRRSFDRPRPCLLIVGGAFPPNGYMHEHIKAFPGANVVVSNLPGMGTPWSPAEVPALTAGLQEVAGWLFADLPLVVFGVSTGALLALGFKAPNLVRTVVLEPFLQTGNLWPFIADSRARLERYNHRPAIVSFLWTVFGIGATTLENRDYRYLAQGLSVPTDVILGGMPLLPERPLPAWPSFASDEDRAAFRRNPLATLHEGPPDAGHGYGSVPGSGKQVVHGVLAAALAEAARACG